MSRRLLHEALKLHIGGLKLERGEVHHIEIRHDHDCGHWEGRECDCDPQIVSGKPVDAKYQGGAA